MPLLQWLWPSESPDEKLARWQSLYVFDYKSKNTWKKLSPNDESEFVEYFKKEWTALSIDTKYNTRHHLTENNKLIGLNNKQHEKNRLRILRTGFIAYQYNKLFK